MATRRVFGADVGLTVRRFVPYRLSVVQVTERRPWTPTEVDVLEAVRTCCERWGIEKVTVDDIARASGVSRATLYRLFPGGRDVIFEAHRVYELDRFFAAVLGHIDGAETLEDLLVRTVTCATRELRADQHLALMLASEPGAVLGELTVDGLPRIIRVATTYLVPLADQFLPRPQSRALIDVVARLVISYFLAPSRVVDFGDEASARTFLRPFLPVLPLIPNQELAP
jgi:AcrR family transcriptional regulator